MNAYQNALAIATDTTGPRLDLARELLKAGNEVVLLEHTVAFSREGERIICEVISRVPPPARSPAAFLSEIEDARRLLGESTIRDVVETSEQEWIVVDDYGTSNLLAAMPITRARLHQLLDYLDATNSL